MNKFLNRLMIRLSRRRKPSLERDGEAALNNYALHLAQEWGNDWLQPIQDRLGKSVPSPSAAELDGLSELAQEAMHYCYDLAYRLYEEREGGEIDHEWKKICLSKYA